MAKDKPPGRKQAGVKRGSGSKSREEQNEFRIDRMLNPQNYEDGIIPDWDTTGKGEGEPLTLEDYVNLKPFKMEDLNTTIAFRAPDKLLRAAQRIKEKSGGVYDLMSDLHRDIYVLGLILMSERHEDILGGEIVIERAKSRVQLKKEIEDSIRRLGEQLLQENESDRRADYLAYVEFVRRRPIKIQEMYLTAMETNSLLAELRRRMVEQAKAEDGE